MYLYECAMSPKVENDKQQESNVSLDFGHVLLFFLLLRKKYSTQASTLEN